MQVLTARDLGLAVRSQRLRVGWSQSALAERAGTSRKWISELEQGKPRAEFVLILRTLDALGLTLIVSGGPATVGDEATGREPIDLDEVLAELDADR